MVSTPSHILSNTLTQIEFSPYGQKIRSVLAGSNISFQRSDQPIVLPRPILEKLDITYRRIPVLAIGKDIYANSSLIIDEITSRFNALLTTPADKAYEQFGIEIFTSALNVIPVAALTPEFIKDRETIFPALKNPDYASLRPSGLAEMRQKFNIIEDEFLNKSLFVAGEYFGLADVHVGWAVGWSLEKIGLGQEPGFSHQDYPKIYKWLSSWPKPDFKDIGEEDVKDFLLRSEYSAKNIGVDEKDYLGIKQGTEVAVENSDTKAGAHPQKGKLVGLDQREVVVELKNGLRVHFPRVGYVVKEATAGGLASRF
jgi:glutathione S-transferase